MSELKDLPFEIGESFTFAKTVGESDVYLFAGITGDLSPNHVNEEYMSKNHYNHRIIHGLLGLSLTSYCSTEAALKSKMVCVSYGYDKVRFLKPIYFGDTVNVKYTIAEKNSEKMTTVANVEVFNQRGELCTVAKHILKYFDE